MTRLVKTHSHFGPPFRHEYVQDPEFIDAEAIDRRIEEGFDLTVQFSTSSYSPELLGELDLLCAKHGSALCVRFYGHAFDGVSLEALPNLRNLAVDCMQSASNLRRIAELAQLESLVLDVERLTTLEFLGAAQLRSLAYLRLGRTSRAVDLKPIENLRRLKALSVDGKYKSLGTIGALPDLQGMCIWHAPKKVKLDFVNQLPRLRDLTLMLGGRNDIDEVRHPGLRTLEIIRVRGFSSLALEAFPTLENLIVQDEPRLERLNLSGAQRLTRARLCHCKSLAELGGVPTHPALRELRIIDTAIDLQAIISDGLPESLETPAFYGKECMSRAIRERLREIGYAVE